ncbi:MAG TPA: hypothetical protein VGZ48_07655 [Candidatus Acidoferrales bacterium]|jgi:hypothetical protein|nr:hypothetical protein [Candidatus Acidoferrales bacterium]
MKTSDVKKAIKKFGAVRKDLHSKLGKLEKQLDKRLSKIESRLAKLKR